MNKVYSHAIDHQEKRYKLIACEIMFREACYLLSQTNNVVDVTFLPQGLHDMGEEKMKAILQEEIDKVEPEKYEAILLGYGLCNNGVRGLTANTQMVIPRAHDCITLFMGSKERYQEYFNINSGTYYETSGWIERESGLMPQGSAMDGLGMNMNYEEYAAEYGEENAQFLMETLGNWVKNYKKMTFIDMTVTNGTSSVSFGNSEMHRLLSKEKADELGWEFENIKGDVRLIKKLIGGEWNSDEFQIIPPGGKIIPTNTNEIVSFE